MRLHFRLSMFIHKKMDLSVEACPFSLSRKDLAQIRREW